MLEIGPGIGTLTQGLAQSGAAVTSVELDQRLLPVLEHTLEAYDNVRIVHGDVLKTNLPELMGQGSYKVCANLPYYITTPIIMALLEQHLPIECMVVMVQKEVAERMTARPGSKAYGALSVSVQYYTEPEIMFDVPPKAFLPAPEVTSAVVRMKVRQQPPVALKEERAFFHVVKAAFQQRRKMLTNTLKSCGMDKEMADRVLAAAGIDSSRRGETLSLEEFAALANAWVSLRGESSNQ